VERIHKGREESESLLTYRDDLRESDSEEVRRFITSTGVFSQQGIEVAVEFVVERMEKGIRSGYYSLFAEEAEMLDRCS
jgi:16S rRNA G1207 methylase RsmC